MNTRISDAAVEADAWSLADLVRADLDRQSCPDAYMRIAMESVVKHFVVRHPAKPEAVRLRDELREQAAFEAWAKAKGYGVARIQLTCDPPKDGGYASALTEAVWQSWQAAASYARQS